MVIGAALIGTGSIGAGQIGVGSIGVGPIGVGPIGVGQTAVGQIGVGQIAVGSTVVGSTGVGRAGVGPIGRGAAQRLARQELSKEIYHPGFSFLGWLKGEIGRLFNAASSVVPGGWWSLVALVALAVVIVAVVLARVGPPARARRAGPGPLRGSLPMTAREHRELAQRLAASGDHSGAILEYVRAIAAGLEERAILASGPGRTADELAAEAGRLLPTHADDLAAAARLFDDIRYGGRDGTAEGAARLRDLDAMVAIAAAARREDAPTRPASAISADVR